MPALSSATRSGKPRRSGGPGAGTTFRCVSGGAARSPAMRICASAPPHQSMATRPPPTAARLRPGRYRPPPHSVLYVSLKVRLPGGYRSRYFPFPLARPPRSQKPGTALHRRLPKALRASDVCSKAQPQHRADTSHHLPRNKCRPQPGGLLRRRYIRARPARTERPPGRGRAGERRRRPSLTARRRRCSPPQGSPHAKDTEDTALPSPPSARRGRGGARTLRPPDPRGALQPSPPARGSVYLERPRLLRRAARPAAAGSGRGAAWQRGAVRGSAQPRLRGGCGAPAGPGSTLRAPGGGLCSAPRRRRRRKGREEKRCAAPLRSAFLSSPPSRPPPPRCCAAPRERHLKWRPPPPRREPLPSGGSEPTARAGGAGEPMCGRGRGGRSPAGLYGNAGAAAGRLAAMGFLRS